MAGSNVISATIQRPARGVTAKPAARPVIEAVTVPGEQGAPGPSGSVGTVNGQIGNVVITATDVGLGNVANLAPVDQPVSTAQAQADTAVSVAAANDASAKASAAQGAAIATAALDASAKASTAQSTAISTAALDATAKANAAQAAAIASAATALAIETARATAAEGTKAAKGSNSDITALTGLTTPLSQTQGGLGNTIGDASGLSVTATGGGAARTLVARDGDRPAAGADYPSAATLSAAATARLVSEYAFGRLLLGPDGSQHFAIEYTPLAVNSWLVSGGIANGQPVLATYSSTQANVSGTIALQGTGGLYVGNGSGVLAAILDPGLGTTVDAYPALEPGSAAAATAQVLAKSQSGQANVSLALVPAGTGALQRNYPDGTTIGGTARGRYTVDWQAFRSVSTTVAQADYSVISGGADNSTVTTRGQAYQTISGGRLIQLGGAYSWCPGGFLADDRLRDGIGVWSAGQFTTRGDNQASDALLRALSTSTTAVRLTSDGANTVGAYNIDNLPANSAYVITALLNAKQISGSAGAQNDTNWRVVAFCVKRGSAISSTALVGSVAILASGNDTNAANWVWAVAADATQGGVSISFTGEANKNVRATARLLGMELVG